MQLLFLNDRQEVELFWCHNFGSVPKVPECAVGIQNGSKSLIGLLEMIINK